jgi:hypothetical protein
MEKTTTTRSPLGYGSSVIGQSADADTKQGKYPAAKASKPSSLLGGLSRPANAAFPPQPLISQRKFAFKEAQAWAAVPEAYRVRSGILKAAKQNRLDILKTLVASKNETVNIDYQNPQTGQTAWDIAARTNNVEMQNVLGLPKKYDTPTGAFDAIESGDRAALRLWLAKGYDPNVSHPTRRDLTPFTMAARIGQDMMACDLASAAGISLDEAYYTQHRSWNVEPQEPWSYGIFKTRLNKTPIPESKVQQNVSKGYLYTADMSGKYALMYRNDKHQCITRDFDPKTGLMSNNQSVFEFMRTLEKSRQQHEAGK